MAAHLHLARRFAIDEEAQRIANRGMPAEVTQALLELFRPVEDFVIRKLRPSFNSRVTVTSPVCRWRRSKAVQLLIRVASIKIEAHEVRSRTAHYRDERPHCRSRL